ncbi:MAG: type II toxin-antitoxin system Phd/YefM family antitoxin [Stellaceae bacterium]
MESQRKGAEQARNELPRLLKAAEQGRSTVITRHGKPIAALVPIKDFEDRPRQLSILDLRGSGRGLWGKDSTATIRKMRDEWDR